MKGTSKRELAIMAMVAVLIGGAVAAVAAVGEGTSRHAKHARLHRRAVGPRDLAAASAYLGVSAAQLAGDLQGGKTLANVADTTPGKSPAGLIEALVAEKRQRLQRLTAALPRRVHAEVNGNGAAPALGGQRDRSAAAGAVAAPDRLETLAAGYLGITPAQLQQELRSGHTLGQVANATPGRSALGLVGTLVLARREQLAEALAAHRISPARAAALSQRLVRRVSTTVNRGQSR
jgi:hypothetical protein